MGCSFKTAKQRIQKTTNYNSDRNYTNNCHQISRINIICERENAKYSTDSDHINKQFKHKCRDNQYKIEIQKGNDTKIPYRNNRSSDDEAVTSHVLDARTPSNTYKCTEAQLYTTPSDKCYKQRENANFFYENGTGTDYVAVRNANFYSFSTLLLYVRNVLTAQWGTAASNLVGSINLYSTANTRKQLKAALQAHHSQSDDYYQYQQRQFHSHRGVFLQYLHHSFKRYNNQCSQQIDNTVDKNAYNYNITKSSISPPSPCTATLTTTYNLMGHSYYQLLRNSISFYAASSVILVLCYLTTTTSAAYASSPDTTSFDKHPIFDESSSDKEILDLLLEKKRYDKRLLPPVNDEDFCCGLSSPDMAKNQNTRRLHNRGTLTVNVNVLLLSLASPDESSLKYEVEFLLNQQWNDPRLQYGNKSHYDFLNALHHHDSIWTPDTYFIMHGDFKDPIIPMHFALRIYRNGTITYAMRRHLILSCQGSLHIFPFDDPKCSFSMESISYEEPQIKYVWKNDEDTLRKSPSLTTLNAYLIKNQTTACDQNSWRGNYSCLQVELTFTRDRAYYFTTVFIPGIILVTSSFITFWLEWNAVPARVMIGVTTMLNFFTTSNGFRSTLPVVSNLTAMNVWDGVCMCFIYASLLEFVCVNYVGRKRPQHNVVYRPGENPVTQRLPAVLSRIGVILASPMTAAGISSARMSTSVTPTSAATTTETCTHFGLSKTNGNFSDSSLRSCSRERYRNFHYNPTISSQALGALVDSNASQDISTVTADNSPGETAKLNFQTLCSMSTNTPPFVKHTDLHLKSANIAKNVTEKFQPLLNEPIKPPRKKTSRSTSPAIVCKMVQLDTGSNTQHGEKRRDVGAPNEIVACTTCGSGNSPCTHSVNNGCATETCFVQLRKKEPPHPIRVAKTIDVIARITFPTAYAIFLIFFFVHYKGFS